MSRVLNEGFSFSALETTGRFVRFQGPANVAVEGRMYHEIRDVLSSQGRPSHWLIYDANARAGRSAEDRPPEETIDLVRQYLERVNAFVDYFRSAADQVPNNTAPATHRRRRRCHHPYRWLTPRRSEKGRHLRPHGPAAATSTSAIPLL